MGLAPFFKQNVAFRNHLCSFLNLDFRAGIDKYVSLNNFEKEESRAFLAQPHPDTAVARPLQWNLTKNRSYSVKLRLSIELVILRRHNAFKSRCPSVVALPRRIIIRFIQPATDNNHSFM